MSKPVPVLLMNYDLRFGGTECQLCETALHLDRSRFTPHVACIRLQGRRRAELEREGVPLVECFFPSFGSWRVFEAARRMATYLHRHRIQVVHSFDVPGNLFAVPVAFLSRVPVVLSSQRAFREVTPGWYHRFLRLTDRLVDGTVVNSANLREHLQRHDGIAAKRLTLVYNSVDLERFSPSGPKADVLAGCSPVIGCTSMLRPEKGVGTLIEAFALLSARYPCAGLLLVGTGPQHAEMETRAEQLGLTGRIHFAGPVMDVAPWLRRMDIFALPSLSEALSNSLIEAMATGCVAVASDVGGNAELVCDSLCRFRPGDAEDLAQTLEPLLGDGDLRARVAAEGRAFVQSTFSREESLGRLGDLYMQHLRRKGVAP